jgi:hypothetical protein
VSIEDVAQELYGLAPEEFTSARNARVKEARDAGDRDLAAAVQGLRKPTTGAWLLNRFVRRHDDEVAQVLALGERLREAQGTLGAAELRALDQQRRQLTAAVARQVRSLGEAQGRRVSTQVTADVEETLRSAMVDEAAGRALASGLLTDTFSATGIEPVDLTRVVALPAAGAAPAPRCSPQRTDDEDASDAEHRRRLEAAKEAVAQADSALAAAGRATSTARLALTETTDQHDRLTSERDELRRRVEELEARVREAAAVRDTARRDRERAERVEAEARATAERAHEELDGLLG